MCNITINRHRLKHPKHTDRKTKIFKHACPVLPLFLSSPKHPYPVSPVLLAKRCSLWLCGEHRCRCLPIVLHFCLFEYMFLKLLSSLGHYIFSIPGGQKGGNFCDTGTTRPVNNFQTSVVQIELKDCPERG